MWSNLDQGPPTPPGLVKLDAILPWLVVSVASPPVLVRLPVIFVLDTPESSADADTINLSLKSGVPLLRSHRYHPVGIDAIDPDHMIIPPVLS